MSESPRVRRVFPFLIWQPRAETLFSQVALATTSIGVHLSSHTPLKKTDRIALSVVEGLLTDSSYASAQMHCYDGLVP